MLQRVTGLVAFVFIVLHVFHMHGWFHADVWLRNVAQPLGGAQFRPYNAASTLGAGHAGCADPSALCRRCAVLCLPFRQRPVDDGNHVGCVDRARLRSGA